MLFLPSHREEIIRPYKRKGDPEIDGSALMVMVPDILRRLLKISKHNKIKSYSHTFFKSYRIKHENGSYSSLAGPFLGAPQAVLGMEKLIALGAKSIWVIGYCGSLNSELRIGDILIPVDAVSEEGTSGHYPIAGKTIKTAWDLNNRLANLLEKNSLPYKYGRVWTTDAPYRETIEKIKMYMNDGIMGVEMELSALLTVAVYREIKLSGLLLVSDELFDLKWCPGFSSPILKKRSRQAGELILGLLTS